MKICNFIVETIAVTLTFTHSCSNIFKVFDFGQEKLSFFQREKRMKYTKEECIDYIKAEGIEFILLSFVDLRGVMRTTTIMPSELEKAFDYGIAIDGSAIAGFDIDGVHSDLFLHPDLDTLTLLPWRIDQGKAVKFFCYVKKPDGKSVLTDSRMILKKAVDKAREKGLEFYFGTEYEFYLFPLLDDGSVSKRPIDEEGYMASSPLDKGEAIRREICLTLDSLSLRSEASHHEEGPGQNEIDFSYSTALEAADNSLTFLQVVRNVSMRNGLYADFSPKPLEDECGNGLHINISVKGAGEDSLLSMIAGIMKRIREMTLFLNSTSNSYKRLGKKKAPKYISYSYGNRSQLIRIPAASGKYVRAELRSPDGMCNIYIALALLINASMEGIENNLVPPPSMDKNLYNNEVDIEKSPVLPESIEEAKEEAGRSDFIYSVLPDEVVEYYLEHADD